MVGFFLFFGFCFLHFFWPHSTQGPCSLMKVKPTPLPWKHIVLTAGPPGKSPRNFLFLKNLHLQKNVWNPAMNMLTDFICWILRLSPPVRVAAATCNCAFNQLPSFKQQETSLYFCFQLLLENQKVRDRFPT